jgi:protein-tyrosine phosphatase
MMHHRGIGSDDMNHIHNGIWIGGHSVLKSAHWLTSKGISNVVNAAIEFITETPELINWEDLQRNGIEVHNTYWDDTMTQPIFPSASLEAAVKKIDEVIRQGKPILVNCAMGKSRSTSLVIAYLMARCGMSFDEALQTCQRSRPICKPNPNFERQLRQLEASLRMGTMPNSPLSSPQTKLRPDVPTRLSAPLSPRTPTTPAISSPHSANSLGNSLSHLGQSGFGSQPPAFPAAPYANPSATYTNPYASNNNNNQNQTPYSPTFGNAPQSPSSFSNRTPYAPPYNSTPQSPSRPNPASPPMSPALSGGSALRATSPTGRLQNFNSNLGGGTLTAGSRLSNPRAPPARSGGTNPLLQSYGITNNSLPSSGYTPSSGTYSSLLNNNNNANKFNRPGAGVGALNALSKNTGAPGLGNLQRGYRGNDYMSPLRRRLSL